MNRTQLFLLVLLAATAPTAAAAQGTAQDYARSDRVRELLSGKVVGEVTDVSWIDDTHRFWYRRTAEGGHDFVLVDADGPEKGPAFDHERLAAALSEALGEGFTAVTLPFDEFEYVDGGGAVEFEVGDRPWRCDLDGYACSALEEPEDPGRSGGGSGQRGEEAVVSPDSAWEAAIRNYNVAVRRISPDDGSAGTGASGTGAGGSGRAAPGGGGEGWRILSHDGSGGDAYDLRSLEWSPDSRKIAVYRTRPGFERIVRYIESSPDDQIQPEYMERKSPRRSSPTGT